MSIEQLIEWLKVQNVAKVSKDTGIPKNRMYQWTSGNGLPKTEDYNILVAYASGKSLTTSGNTPIVTKGTGDQKTGPLARVMRFLREFDAPMAKWVANKVDGPGLDEEDILLLEDKLTQIRKNIDTEMQEEIKILPLSKKKKDNSQ